MPSRYTGRLARPWRVQPRRDYQEGQRRAPAQRLQLATIVAEVTAVTDAAIQHGLSAEDAARVQEWLQAQPDHPVSRLLRSLIRAHVPGARAVDGRTDRQLRDVALAEYVSAEIDAGRYRSVRHAADAITASWGLRRQLGVGGIGTEALRQAISRGLKALGKNPRAS